MTGASERVSQQRPTWLQGLLIAGGGLAAAIGGCATFVAIDSLENMIGWAGGLVFVVGAVAIPVGGGMFIYGVIKALVTDAGKTADR